MKAKHKGKKVKLWGNGMQKREIIHVDDFISNLIKINKKTKNDLINIGAGSSYSIKYFAKIICNITKYDFKKITYDKDQYIGALNKKLNIKKIQKIFPGYKKNLIPLKKGLLQTINWYEKKFY